MNAFDLLVLAAALLAVVGGWRLGLVTRALGWVGAIIGVVAAVLLVPVLARWINPPSDGGILLLTAGTLILLVSICQAIGVSIGSRLRPEASEEHLRRVDSFGGSVLGVIGVLALVWLMTPLMASTSGWVASATRSSAVARVITEHLPEPPATLQNLERSLVDGNFPQLFTDLQPAPELPAPPEGSPLSAEQLQVLAASSVKIQGDACSMLQSGSGFSVGDGLWLTNAHVVAGTSGIQLTTAQGDTGTGEVIRFDPKLDLALVRSTNVAGPPLEVVPADEGDTGLVLGFPGGGPFDPSPHLVGDHIAATGYDIYDTEVVRRNLLVLASELAPGDSGSAVVNSDGEVVGVAVAVAPDRAGVAYALDGENLPEWVSDGTGQPVDTGTCLG
ncbi:MAG: MarP family serine protease [Microthrixaceae bacterium]